MGQSLRIAYLSLQQVAEGLDSWAAVNEVITGLEETGIVVDRWFPEYGPGGAPGPLGRIAEMLRLQRTLIAHLAEYDALYVRGHPLAWLCSRAASRRGIPVVQECNGTYADLYLAWPQARALRWVFDAMQRSQYAMSARVVCVTQGLAEWVRTQAPGAATVVIPNGVNLEVFCDTSPRYPGLPERYAVFFGNFAPWQGIEVLVRAFESETWPADLPLVVAGDGVLTPEIEAASKRHPDSLIYLGHVPYAKLGSVVANAVVSVIPINAPERAETGFSPLKLYESMACATPVVVADTGGLEEIVKQYECGASFAVGDADDLARRVTELTAAAHELVLAGRSGRRAALEECSWTARAAARADVLRDVVSGRAGS